MNSADPGIQDLLEGLLTDTMGCLFVGGVDSESVSNACAAVHGLAIILPVRTHRHPGQGQLLFCCSLGVNSRVNTKAYAIPY